MDSTTSVQIYDEETITINLQTVEPSISAGLISDEETDTINLRTLEPPISAGLQINEEHLFSEEPRMFFLLHLYIMVFDHFKCKVVKEIH